MDSHDLAKKLLELPNQHITIITQQYTYDIINSVSLCGCEAEIIINVE